MTCRSDKQTGGTAFPAQFFDERATGMTLRDYFAAKALQGFLVDAECGPESVKDFAESAYIMADAMLKARER